MEGQVYGVIRMERLSDIEVSEEIIHVTHSFLVSVNYLITIGLQVIPLNLVPEPLQFTGL